METDAKVVYGYYTKLRDSGMDADQVYAALVEQRKIAPRLVVAAAERYGWEVLANHVRLCAICGEWKPIPNAGMDEDGICDTCE